MQVKQFLIQFECSDNTRWLEDDEAVCAFVASVATASVRFKTDGPFPLTTVFPIQGGQQITTGQRLVAVELKDGLSR